MVLDGLGTANTKAAYRDSLVPFLQWRQGLGSPPLNRGLVQHWKAHLLGEGKAPATVNLRLTAIRRLVNEAADTGLLERQVADAICRVKSVRAFGSRDGTWLTEAEAQALLNAPPEDTAKGLRDRALLAVLLGAGLRRAEVVGLTFAHLRKVRGRWAIVDLVGKGNRVRTVPIPAWCKEAIDRWAEVAGLSDGLVFRSMRSGGRVNDRALRPEALAEIVRGYARKLGLDVSPHDLRRTFAKLVYADGEGAPLPQIQLTLGHAQLETTMGYLGIEQNLVDAPCDRLPIGLE